MYSQSMIINDLLLFSLVRAAKRLPIDLRPHSAPPPFALLSSLLAPLSSLLSRLSSPHIFRVARQSSAQWCPNWCDAQEQTVLLTR